MDAILGLLWLFSVIALALAGEYCTDYSYGYYRTRYCSYGCCGDYPDEYCCGVYVWAIVLAVIGGILFISFIILCVCCVYKKKGHNGRVMTTAGTTVTTVNYGQPGMQPVMQPGAQPYGYMQPAPGYQPSPGFQPPPPAYATSSTYPPPNAFGQQPSDPAFPPPPPKY